MRIDGEGYTCEDPVVGPVVGGEFSGADDTLIQTLVDHSSHAGEGGHTDEHYG